ncbi:hypothetical protein FOZ63_031996, partial [Perkinsus olseni]
YFCAVPLYPVITLLNNFRPNGQQPVRRMAVQLGSSSRASLIHPVHTVCQISLCLVSSPAEHIVDKIGWIEANLGERFTLEFNSGTRWVKRVLLTPRIGLLQGHAVITTSVDPGSRSLPVHFLFEAAYNSDADHPHRLRGWFFNRAAAVEFIRRLRRTVSPLL